MLSLKAVQHQSCGSNASHGFNWDWVVGVSGNLQWLWHQLKTLKEYFAICYMKFFKLSNLSWTLKEIDPELFVCKTGFFNHAFQEKYGSCQPELYANIHTWLDVYFLPKTQLLE